MSLLINSTVKKVGNQSLTKSMTMAFNLNRMVNLLSVNTTDTEFTYAETDPNTLKRYTIDDTYASVKTAKDAYVPGRRFEFSVLLASGSTSAQSFNVDDIIYLYADPANSSYSYVEISGTNQTTTKKIHVVGVAATLVTNVNEVDDVVLDDITVNNITVNELLQIVSTSSSATGVVEERYHNSASPAISDIIATNSHYGEDSAGNKQEYVRLTSTITDPTSTSEDATYEISVASAGAITKVAQFLGTGFKTVNGTVASPAVMGAATNSGVYFGSGIAGFSTAGSHYAELQGDGAFVNAVSETTGGFKTSVANLVSPLFFMVAPQALSGDGAVTVNQYCTLYTSTGGAQALTMADGVAPGQVKKVFHAVDGGSGVLTPDHPSGFATVTFTAAGDYATFIWNGTAWILIDFFGVTVA